MRSTPESEAAQVADARAALADARRALAQAQLDAEAATGPRSAAGAELASAHRLRVALLERRERDALARRARGDRRRGRTSRWRRALGLRPRDAPAAPARSPTILEATARFLDQPAAHDTGEDIHPSALDPPQADLQAALARASLARKEEERDARDA